MAGTASLFHPSLEGAQHGKKGLEGFLKFTEDAGATGVQPSHYMVQDEEGGWLPAATIKQMVADHELHLDGISGHCLFWVHTTAWTGSPTIRPFIHASMLGESPEAIEAWAEKQALEFLDLCKELGLLMVPMFWGVAHGWEPTTGYMWGQWAWTQDEEADEPGPWDYDLIAEGDERFVTKTAGIREHAAKLGITLGHEIHAGTSAMCARDLLHLAEICGDEVPDEIPADASTNGLGFVLGVNADCSHCWEGEDWRTRFTRVGPRVVGCHVKQYEVIGGMPVRSMEPDWRQRGMRFTRLDKQAVGVDLLAYAELMEQTGYPARYMALHGTESAPLVGEAESATEDLDVVAADAVKHIGQRLCYIPAGEAFDKAIGAVGTEEAE